jgi:TP901 family phage tail tape measure protein
MDDILGTLLVEFKADLNNLSAGSARAKGELRSVDEAARSSSGGFSVLKFMAANALMEVGRKAVDAGVATLKMAGDFDAGVTSLVTGAGESQKNIKMVSDGMLAMGPAVGETTKQLEAGMYMIESGGFHGAAGLNILKMAAEGAKVGNADLGVTADATDTILKNFGSTGLTAAQAVNTLIATVSHGKTHMQDLASSLSQILPTASAARVSLDDTAAAMATMTGEGVPAAQAATYLRQTIISLEAPGSKAVSTLKEIGLTSADVSTEMQHSLPGALQMITDALKTKFPEGSAAYVEAVKNISGGSRTMQGMLDLTGTHLQTLKDNVLTIVDAVKKGGDSIVGWTNVQGQFNQKLDQAKSIVETTGIVLGEKLLPEVSQGLDLFTKLAPAISDTSGPLAHLAGSVATFGATVANTVQKSGAFQSVLQTIHDTLPGVEQFVGNVADALANKLLPPTLDLIKNFSLWVDKSGVVTTALHGLGAGVQTVSSILSPFIWALSNVFNWLSQNKPATDALVQSVIILGGAFVALKLANTVAGFSQMFSKMTEGKGIIEGLSDAFNGKLNGTISDFLKNNAPNLKGVFGDIGTKAKSAGTDVASIGVSAKTSAGEVVQSSLWEEGSLDTVDTKVKAVNADLIATGPAAAEGGAVAKAGLSGLLGTLGTIAGFAGLLALPFVLASPSEKKAFVPDKKDQYPAPPSFWDLLKNLGGGPNQARDLTNIIADGIKKDTQQAQNFADTIDKAWQDMESLGAYAESHNRILGNMLDPMVITQSDVKVQELKSHLDDLPKPQLLQILTPQVVAARLKVIDLKSHIDDLPGPVSVGVLTPQVVAGRQKVIDLKSHIDDLKGPVSIGVLTPGVITARQKVIDLKSHIDDLHNPVSLSIYSGSVDTATAKVMYLKSQLDDMPSPSVSVSAGGISPFRGHAAGGFSPIGEPFMFNEQGPELGMAVPGGVQFLSHSESMNTLGGGGSGDVIEVHPHIYIGNREVTDIVMTDATSTVRRKGRNRR